MTIKHRDLASVDLNLLVALDALLTEQSVTRAAGEVGVGQSAMSSSLARLRKFLGDELLTRAPEGMQLTPRAMALIEPVRAALRQFQRIVLQEDTFDPATVERAFTLGIPGSVESYLVPRLLALLRREAPGVCLSLRGLDYGTVLHELDKAALLRVLERLEIPHRTNGTENDIRTCVAKRKISGGTVSEAGRIACDVMLGPMKTCAKLGLSFFSYLGDRLGILDSSTVPPLPDLITHAATI